MKTYSRILQFGLGLMLLPAMTVTLRGEITVRLSVKYILQPDGTRPAGDGVNNIDISTQALFDIEIKKGNQALASTGRGYRLAVTYDDIQPPAPAGEGSGYWFTLDARANRATIEAAATANAEAKTTWRWRDNAINIYVNNSSSGQCSFVGRGSSISLGATIFTLGTVIHEIGHFFNLSHTHAGDPRCADGSPFFVANGDGLASTIDDHNCLTQDSLSMSNFQGRAFAALTAEEQARVNSSWLNVMSYHQEDQLLEEQMDIWAQNANGSRLGFCSGRTWFVAIGGNDNASGADANSPLATMFKALLKVTSPEGNRDDVILLRTGTYIVAPSNPINTPCTLSATRGPVIISTP